MAWARAGAELHEAGAHQNGPATMPTMAQTNSSTVPMMMITSWKRGAGTVGGSAPAPGSRPSHAAEAGEDDRSLRTVIISLRNRGQHFPCRFGPRSRTSVPNHSDN